MPDNFRIELNNIHCLISNKIRSAKFVELVDSKHNKYERNGLFENLFNMLFFISDGDIDFLTHYKLVDPGKVESYARAFVVEDENFDTVITAKVIRKFYSGQQTSKFGKGTKGTDLLPEPLCFY